MGTCIHPLPAQHPLFAPRTPPPTPVSFLPFTLGPGLGVGKGPHLDLSSNVPTILHLMSLQKEVQDFPDGPEDSQLPMPMPGVWV